MKVPPNEKAPLLEVASLNWGTSWISSTLGGTGATPTAAETAGPVLCAQKLIMGSVWRGIKCRTRPARLSSLRSPGRYTAA